MNQGEVPRQRAIIDRRQVAGDIAALARDGGAAARPAIVAVLRAALDRGRAELADRLEHSPSAGHEITRGHSFLIDQMVRIIHDHVTGHDYPLANPTDAERLSIMAVGGYGRAEMAPRSDVDIAFVTPGRRTAWCEQVIEAILYYLWDLGLTVGHASRSADETIRMAADDLTIRTALLESRFVWGDRPLHDEITRRFRSEIVQESHQEFVAAKLAERNARHERMGGSRYVVEPNVKDGKGGLRDLHTLYWIGKYLHGVRRAAELVDAGLFTRAEYRAFRQADSFLLAVRCHLHVLAGRAEDRLTFDMQRAIAERMRFNPRPGKSAVERFMQFYFLQAKRVGSLTGVFLAHLEEELSARRRRTGLLAAFTARARSLNGYRVHGGRIAAPADDWFRKDPVRLVELFQLAQAHDLDIHPETRRLAARDSGLIREEVRRDARANALFLDLLTGRNDPESSLRWMNEAGVLGRFIPDFGRVEAQMQFDMYHHYTVDEHTIRAIGLLARVERGELAAEHPRATRIMGEVESRRVAYVAALLHDIAKGRGGDHSELGAGIALRLCPRFGLSVKETELTAWLVRHHLLMSRTAFKRDVSDPKTVEDFAGAVGGLERLRHLAVLTAVDIRAVGPGTWNSWKGQLLGTLYDAAEERLRLGHVRHGREERVAAKRRNVAALLGADAALADAGTDGFGDAFWIAESEQVIAANLRALAAAKADGRQAAVACALDADRGATLVTVIAVDQPGLFFRLAGGIHLAGGNIIDARIHTTSDGWAVDNFLVQNPAGLPLAEEAQLDRIRKNIVDALSGAADLAQRLDRRPLADQRAGAFRVAPRVTFDNAASGRFTVVEVVALDRPALLYRLARALFDSGLVVHSAHITAYGERASDTFYVTNLRGEKIFPGERMDAVEQRLLTASGDAKEQHPAAA
ncbi:[protein-PII] uridylyltransferase [Porphyrobacter sp. GA68]|uniref:[protein-PII] uridylyltransferase n=1 Tax=Porphyrobacter sp. GA68 TaxID=2883480 RepID=UPI001D186A60|nr:[protein-PII] uridylyltransferase [Porphyrobacter sp. GA68]